MECSAIKLCSIWSYWWEIRSQIVHTAPQLLSVWLSDITSVKQFMKSYMIILSNTLSDRRSYSWWKTWNPITKTPQSLLNPLYYICIESAGRWCINDFIQERVDDISQPWWCHHMCWLKLHEYDRGLLRHNAEHTHKMPSTKVIYVKK